MGLVVLCLWLELNNVALLAENDDIVQFYMITSLDVWHNLVKSDFVGHICHQKEE
jgi:hypothetical protein